MMQYSFDCLQQVMASPPTVVGGTAADPRDPFDVDEDPAVGGEEDEEADLGAILRTAYTSGGGGGGGGSIIPSSSRPLSRSDTSSVDEGEPGSKWILQDLGSILDVILPSPSVIPVEMEDLFTRMSHIFFSFLSQI